LWCPEIVEGARVPSELRLLSQRMFAEMKLFLVPCLLFAAAIAVNHGRKRVDVSHYRPSRHIAFTMVALTYVFLIGALLIAFRAANDVFDKGWGYRNGSFERVVPSGILPTRRWARSTNQHVRRHA